MTEAEARKIVRDYEQLIADTLDAVNQWSYLSGDEDYARIEFDGADTVTMVAPSGGYESSCLDRETSDMPLAFLLADSAGRKDMIAARNAKRARSHAEYEAARLRATEDAERATLAELTRKYGSPQ